MKALNTTTKQLQYFLKLCEQAEKLGLEFIKTAKKEYEIKLWDNPNLGLHVECQKYELTTWNAKREAKNRSGHTMLEVWTKHEAEVLQGYIDACIADSNADRWTEIKKSPHTSTSEEDLKWFIDTHSKSKM